MGYLFTLLVVVAAVVWVARVWRAKRDDEDEGTAFRISFHEGRVRDVKGRVPRALYNAFEDVAAHGRVSGDVRANGADLSFSDSVPDGVRQQFRNVFWAARS